MKRIARKISFMLVIIGVFIAIGATSPVLAADGTPNANATPVQYALSVDGKSISLWAYEINGGTYCKLRDIAMALNGTERQFEVEWGGKNNDVWLYPGRTWMCDETYNLAQQAFSTYKAVLLGNTEFFETGIKETLYISQLSQAIGSDSKVTAKAIKFAVVDLDNGGTPKVILWLRVNGHDYYGFEVLRYQDGVVYGCDLPYRAFNQLKADRTFTFSSGAMDSGFGTIKFTEQSYSIDKITYSESSYDSNNDLTVSFFINNERTTQDKFELAIKKQDEKPDATWYSFTDDNIETVFADTW